MTEKAEEHRKRSIWRRPGCLLAGLNFIVVVILALTLGIAYYLPEYIQNKVLPDLGRQLPFESFSANIRRTGILGADIGSIEMGAKEKSAVRAASVRIDYSPSELIFSNTVHIKKLIISGVVINIDLSGNELILPGYKNRSSVVAAGEETSSSGGSYRIRLDRMELQNGVCIVKTAKGTFRIPFNILIRPEGGYLKNINVLGKLSFLNNPVGFRAGLQPEKNGFDLDLSANLLLERFEEFFPDGTQIKGKAAVKCKVEGCWSPINIAALDGSCSFDELNAELKGITVANTGLESVLNFTGGGSDFNASLSGITVDAGIPVELRDFDNKIRLLNGGALIDSVVECRIDKLAEGLELAEPVKLDAALTYSCDSNGTWSVKSAGDDVLIAAIKVKRGSASIAAGPVKWLFQASNSTGAIKGDALFRIKSVNGEMSGTRITLPEVAVQSLFQPGIMTGKLNFTDGAAVNKKLGIKLAGIAADIPARFPSDEREDKGSIKVADIIWNKNSLGKFTSEVSIGKIQAAVNGNFESNLFPGLSVVLKSVYTADGLNCSADINKYSFGENFDPGTLIPDLKGIKISGQLDANARLSLHNGHLESSGKISLEKTVITGEKQALSCEDINLSLELIDLLKLKSAPDQKLTFKTLRIGSIDIYDGTVDFQIESPESMLLEKSSFGWCGGHLYTHALRIYTGKKSYRATVFCDGIKLAQMLNELGVAKAGGNGEVMGRIPVVYDECGLTFDSGFLFSAPGQGNKLCLLDSDKFLAGIPKDTAQFAQLDIASEALRDFDYQWVKINLETKQDMLKVKMQIDGKPADLLPFDYDKQKGYFVRIKGKGAKFQGIKLDINTSVPLNRLLIFNSKLQSMIGGGRK